MASIINILVTFTNLRRGISKNYGVFLWFLRTQIHPQLKNISKTRDVDVRLKYAGVHICQRG